MPGPEILHYDAHVRERRRLKAVQRTQVRRAKARAADPEGYAKKKREYQKDYFRKNPDKYEKQLKQSAKNKCEAKKREPEKFRKRNREWVRADRVKNPDKYKIIDKKHWEENGYFKRNKRYYGLDKNQYLQILDEQSGCCKICQTKPDGSSSNNKKLHVDHDHVTKKVRGLLCNLCNTAMGSFGENLLTLNNIKKYLESPPGIPLGVPKKIIKMPTSKRYILRKKYSIGVEHFSLMYEKQEGKCCICDSEPRNEFLAVDHDHRSLKVRGLLCRMCNLGLGRIKDQIKIIDSMIVYLQTSNEEV